MLHVVTTNLLLVIDHCLHICNFFQIAYDLSGGVPAVQSLKPWLVCVQAQAPKCPVIIVGTHMDRLPKGHH